MGLATEVFILRGDQSIYMPGALGFDRSQGGTLGEFLLYFFPEKLLWGGFLLHWFLFPGNRQISFKIFLLVTPRQVVESQSMLLHMKEQMLLVIIVCQTVVELYSVQRRN